MSISPRGAPIVKDAGDLDTIRAGYSLHLSYPDSIAMLLPAYSLAVRLWCPLNIAAMLTSSSAYFTLTEVTGQCLLY